MTGSFRFAFWVIDSYFPDRSYPRLPHLPGADAGDGQIWRALCLLASTPSDLCTRAVSLPRAGKGEEHWRRGRLRVFSCYWGLCRKCSKWKLDMFFFFFFWCFKTHSNNETLPSCMMQKRLKWRAVFLHSCGTLCHVDCLPACLTAWLPAWLTACLTAYHSSVYFSKSM